MVQRRTLVQALQTSDLSEAAIAFLSGPTPQPVEKNGHSPKAESPVANAGTPSVVEAPADSGSQGTVSVTFRLTAELSSRLLRVSLDRKLKRERPFTQQDIIAEALTRWLKNKDDSL